MMTLRTAALMSFIAAGLVGITAPAQSNDLSTGDKQFLSMAAQANMTEAHLGEMAEAQASDSGVKSFAQTLVQDHTKAYEELTTVSNKTGASIPKGINTSRDAAIRQLEKLKGSGFDRRFLQHEIQDHEKTLAAFKREAEHGKNAEVKGYAQKLIPTLEEHLHRAQELAKTQSRA